MTDDAGYFLHLKLGDNGIVAQIACSQSRNDSIIISVEGGTPIEKFGIKDDTELWFLSKDRLKQFLRKRKREDEKMKRTMVPKSSSAST